MSERHYGFFLSHARAAGDAEPWVQRLFQDLSQRVAELLEARTYQAVGFLDDLIPAGADWKVELAEALGAADVFIALYSPRYLNNAWSMGERDAFVRRLQAAGIGTERARAHLVPVLWSPLPLGQDLPEPGATLALGAGVPGYAENGLRALCMLRAYREQYQMIVERLAHRVAEVTVSAPLPRSAVTITAAPTPARTGTTLAVAVLTGDHGEGGGRGWRPYAQAQVLPLAEMVATIAERLGLSTRIVDARTGAAHLDAGPAVLLIDPWFAAGGEVMRLLSRSLHPWVAPLLVADRGEPRYAERGAETIAEVAGRFQAIGARSVWRMLDIEEVETLMPTLLNRACRQFLRNTPVYLPAGRHSARPRLNPATPSAEEAGR